jgi:hypothetical protein
VSGSGHLFKQGGGVAMLSRLFRRGREPPQASIVEQEKKVVEIPLESLLDEGELNSRLLKLSLLPFLADSRALNELERMYRVKLLLKAGFKSVYSMSSSMLERAYAPYPDEVWRLIPLSGYRGAVYVRDAYYVMVNIPEGSYCNRSYHDHYVRVEGELLKPFHSKPDDIVRLEGIEFHKFRRDTVMGIVEYMNDKADRYGVWIPMFKVLFDEYLTKVKRDISRWDSNIALKRYLYIGYMCMVFKDALYADGSHIEWKPYQKLSEDVLKALLGPDAGEILSYGDVYVYPDDDIRNKTPSLNDELDVLALIRALRDLGFSAACSMAGEKPCVEIFPESGEASIPGHRYVVFPHKDVWKQVKGSSIEVSEVGPEITVSHKDAYRLLREYDGIRLSYP